MHNLFTLGAGIGGAAAVAASLLVPAKLLLGAAWFHARLRDHLPLATPPMKRPQLYRAARAFNDMTTLASGSPKRIARRVKNHVVGRVLAHGGFWRWLWK